MNRAQKRKLDKMMKAEDKDQAHKSSYGLGLSFPMQQICYDGKPLTQAQVVEGLSKIKRSNHQLFSILQDRDLEIDEMKKCYAFFIEKVMEIIPDIEEKAKEWNEERQAKIKADQEKIAELFKNNKVATHSKVADELGADGSDDVVVTDDVTPS